MQETFPFISEVHSVTCHSRSNCTQEVLSLIPQKFKCLFLRLTAHNWNCVSGYHNRSIPSTGRTLSSNPQARRNGTAPLMGITRSCIKEQNELTNSNEKCNYQRDNVECYTSRPWSSNDFLSNEFKVCQILIYIVILQSIRDEYTCWYVHLS